MRIGIPRALLYYQYYPMWKTFFEGMGVEVVVSPTTTQTMLAKGSARVVADTCLPVKVFLGHVISLVNMCDYVFIPAVRSIKSQVYNCSKFLGLPDMTKAVVPEAPPILEIDIDINQGTRKLYQAIYQLGRNFTWNPVRVRQASLAAWQAHMGYRKMMTERVMTPPEAIEVISGKTKANYQENHHQQAEVPTSIALVGHPYLLYDEYINHRLINRLTKAGARIFTPEMITAETLESAVASVRGKAYWTYEEEVVGAGGHYLQSDIDGIIGVMAFGCGPDSLMIDAVHRQAAKLRNAPFMNLTLEEHTAEAGIITRLEAFTDMIKRRKRRQQEACV